MSEEVALLPRPRSSINWPASTGWHPAFGNAVQQYPTITHPGSPWSCRILPAAARFLQQHDENATMTFQADAGALPYTPLGALLREWRTARRMSQLALAEEAGMSARHLSYVETGKSQPSREAISQLANALEMPLRERNALMIAGGYAPEFPENALSTPALERMRQAIDLIIAHQEPYPAFVLDRHWNVLKANQAATRINGLLMNGRSSRHTNLLHQVFDPEDFRSVIINWAEVAEKFIRHAQEQLAASPTDTVLRNLVSELFQYPDVPEHWRRRDLINGPAPVLTLAFHSVEGELRFFETITTFSMPRDLTLDELRIECAFPADDHTAAVCARLASAPP